MAIITMTRELGTRGQDVAYGAAAAMNLKVIHHETIEHGLAGRLGIEETALHRFVGGDASILERWKIDKQKLTVYTAEEIFEFARQGNVVIRGWGATALLRDIPNVMHVRVCAPMAARVRVVMDRLRLSELREARREIERNDAAQARILHGVYGLDSNDPLSYDLILNTGSIPVETCIGTLQSLMHDPAFQETEATRSALEDKRLEWKIRAALMESKAAGRDSTVIEPAAEDGRVMLSGACADVNQKEETERLVRTLAGVKDVENRIIPVRRWSAV